MCPAVLAGNVDSMPITAQPAATRRPSRPPRRGDRAPDVGWLELAIAITLLGSLLTIPLPWANLSLGGAFTVLAAVHVAGRHRLYLAILRRSRRRATVTSLLLGSAIAMTVSGLVQWPGVPAAIPWHGATSMLLLLLTIGHATRRLRRRKRARAGRRAQPTRAPCRRQAGGRPLPAASAE